MTNIFHYIDNFIKYKNVKSILQFGDTSFCVDPQISVIMPVYGNPVYFIHSLNSVIYQDVDFIYEIIVIDNTPYDGSKSEVLKLIESKSLPNIFYYRNEKNIGMTGNWNRGIELSRAELITFCHDDDMLYPQCLSTLWKLHITYPDRWIVPSSRIIDESVSYPLDDTKKQDFGGRECIPFDKIDIFMGNPTNGVGCLFYKRHMINLGGYNEEYYPSQDNALHIIYLFTYGAIRYRQKLYCYRITNKNESNKVYDKFITNGLFYCECMASKMKLPRFVIRMLTHAYKTNTTIVMEREWANMTEPSVRLTISDRIINKVLYYRRIFRQFGF